MIDRHQPAPPSAIGATGRYPEGLDLPPVINPQQAAHDRRKFMQMHGNTADPQMRRAQEMRDQGFTDNVICKETGIGRKRLVRVLGKPITRGNGRMPEHIREKKIADAYRMKAEGFSQTFIANALDVRQQTVSGWFRAQKRQAA